MGVNHDEEYQWSERPKSNVPTYSSNLLSGLTLTLQDLPFNSSHDMSRRFPCDLPLRSSHRFELVLNCSSSQLEKTSSNLQQITPNST